jgi:hypothetical protein
VAVFSPMYVLGSFIKNQMTVAIWIYVWVCYFDPLVLFAFEPVPYWFFIAMALWYSLKSGIVILLALLFLLRIALAI